MVMIMMGMVTLTTQHVDTNRVAAVAYPGVADTSDDRHRYGYGDEDVVYTTDYDAGADTGPTGVAVSWYTYACYDYTGNPNGDATYVDGCVDDDESW